MSLATVLKGIVRTPPQSVVDINIDAKLLDDIEEEINRQLLIGTDGLESLQHQKRLAETIRDRSKLSYDELREQNRQRLAGLVDRTEALFKTLRSFPERSVDDIAESYRRMYSTRSNYHYKVVLSS